VINIKEILKPMFPEIIDGVLNPNPNEDSGFDVVIITGGNKVETPIPTIIPTITSNPNPSVTPIAPSNTPRPSVNPPMNP
jgi:hypothetical protein